MSLYYEAADLIKTLGNSQDSSLKSLVFSKPGSNGTKARKSNPTQLYALITESWKWSSILREVIERTGLLQQEKKLSPQLALVLVHDLLLAKKGIAASESHVLRQAVERHKARLRAELTKSRIRSGCASVEDLRLKLEQQGDGTGIESNVRNEDDGDQDITKWRHPRWLRINTLRTSSDILQKHELLDWRKVDSIEEVLSIQFSKLNRASMVYHVDKNIPNLLAFPSKTDLSSLLAYKRGELISQDKASCFPAYLLSSGNEFCGNILDACAAPGNKTTHIAAIVSEQPKRIASQSKKIRIYATERDTQRANVLTRMLQIAGAKQVEVYAGQDFFRLDPQKSPWKDVSAIILDPSCSGSGIVDRGQTMTFDLPSVVTTSDPDNRKTSGKNKKRKRGSINNGIDQPEPLLAENPIGANSIEPAESNTKVLELRLKSLAALQIKMLTFAFSFPKVQTITYSTCSIYNAENENVVVAALAADVSRDRGWRIMKRDEQVEGLKTWNKRGSLEACKTAGELHGLVDVDAKQMAEACIRCEPFTIEGTQGFFLAGFVRDSMTQIPKDCPVPYEEQQEEAWAGFDN